MPVNNHCSKKKAAIYFSIFFILFFTFFSVLFSGCISTPIVSEQTYYGDIQISSEPVNASIYLDGEYTGFKTPNNLNNILSGNHLITLKLEGYLNSNNMVQIFPDKSNTLHVILTPIVFPPSPVVEYLTHIEVSPNKFNLLAGEIAQIESILAYYSDGTSRETPFEQCLLSSINQQIATVSPKGEVKAVSEGQTVIWATFTENNITKSDYIEINVSSESSNSGNLIDIEVLPDNMNLDIEESQPISSIRAYYNNNTNYLINPNLCYFSVDNDHAMVSNDGIVTGKSNGISTITISYTENNITKNDFINITVSTTLTSQPVFRALLIGIGDYIYYGEDGDLLAPPYDVNKMVEIMDDCQFGLSLSNFQKIETLKDQQATKQNILNKIQTTFSEASTNDISYFYYSGHGITLNQLSYLCPTDFNGETYTAISVDELEADLSALPGTKVIFIDSCHSGGFIGKDISREDASENSLIEEEYLLNFNENVISAFSNTNAKDLLTSDEYQVLTSSHWYETSYEMHPDTGEPFGVFTQGLYEGCSISNNTPADINQNDQITLQEAYDFVAQWVGFLGIDQNVQVHPQNSSFKIFEY